MTFWELGEKQQEEKEYTAWCLRQGQNLDAETLRQLVANPPQLCEDVSDCKYRNVSEGACPCIRSLFNSSDELNEYQRFQRLYIQVRFMEILATSICQSQDDSVESKKELIEEKK